MIIATIGGTKFKLENLADAEALLNIFHRATRCGSSYDENYQDYQYLDEGEKRLSIEITEGDKLITYAEHLERVEARKAKEKKAIPEQAVQ